MVYRKIQLLIFYCSVVESLHQEGFSVFPSILLLWQIEGRFLFVFIRGYCYMY